MYRKILYISPQGRSIEFGPCGIYRLRSIDTSGLGTTSDTVRALNTHGTAAGEILYNQRTIPCRLALVGTDSGRHSMVRLREAWQTGRRVMAPHVTATLQVWDGSDTPYTIRCRPLEVPTLTRKLGAWYNFDVELIADDPFWREVIPEEQTWTGDPIRIYNEQPMEMPFTATVTGPVDSVEITCGGQRLFVNQSIPEGQTLIIDTDRRRVTLDGAYVGHKLSVDSDYFRLPTGENTLEVTCTQPVTFRFIRLYLGV